MKYNFVNDGEYGKFIVEKVEDGIRTEGYINVDIKNSYIMENDGVKESIVVPIIHSGGNCGEIKMIKVKEGDGGMEFNKLNSKCDELFGEDRVGVIDRNTWEIRMLNQISKDIQALTQAIYVTSGCNIKEDILYTINEEIKK